MTTHNVLVTQIEHGPRAAVLVPNPLTYKVVYRLTHRIPSGNAHIWDKYEHFFIEIPKNASLSIQRSLPRESTFGHLYGRYYPKRIRRKLRAIVRNPYDRLVSAYLFMIRGGFNNNCCYLQIRDEFQDFDDWVLRGLNENIVRYSTSFPWQQRLTNGALVPNNGWAEPIIMQTEWLLDGTDNCDYTWVVDQENIGRFENLEEDAYRLLGIKLTKHMNQSNNHQGQKKRWQDYYQNPKVRAKVARLYQRDFDLLGYPTSITS